MALSLPDDVVAAVLRRLPPWDLAVSRCVCKAWRRVVDARRLLRTDLLPLSLGGILLNYHDSWFTQFLSRPTTGAAVSCRLDYMVPPPAERGFDIMPPIYVKDHYNGLLLLHDCVVNPATRQWELLPLRPTPLTEPAPPGMCCSQDEYLVFDPTLSPNYELLIVPNVPYKLDDDDEEQECEEYEWPPSTLILPVFSSKTGSWEERTFGREGEAAGMLPTMVGSRRYNDHQCGYWGGALYICCSDCFVMRILPSDNKYRVIRMPTEDREHRHFYLGKSIKGIHGASLFQGSQLQVWILNDPCGQVEWVLKHNIEDIFPIMPNLNYDEQQRDGPWTLQQYNYRPCFDDDYYVEHEPIVEEKFEWDSDSDNVLEPGSRSKDCCIYFLGFHPYKEIVFLCDKFDRVLAYKWSSSKLQDLGKVFT
uniref:F-box domain-containing protein n=1 Tax=Oryza meridionalis TaxID=40149 RepID=A0A0E0E865_9ORYZ